MSPRPRRSSRGFAHGTPARRLTSWALGPGGDDLPTLDVQAVSSNVNIIMGAGVTPLIPHLTVVRIHGFIEVALTAADAASTGFAFNFGIGIVSAEAFAAGITAIPQPFADIEWPGWMFHYSGSILTTNGALADGDPTDNPLRIPIDVKAMRKFRLNEVMMLTGQFGESASATVRIRSQTRVLVKLP